MSTEWPLVSVVVLSFNRLDDLKETIDYCRSYTYPSLEFIVVDNGSHDGSAEYVAALEAPFRPILVPENSGSAEGHSIGMRAADGEYVITIDDDAFVEDFAIYEMVKLFERFSKLAVVSFNCLNYYQEYAAGIQKSDEYEYSEKEIDAGYFLFTESSAGFRKRVLEEIGYHQPEYFYGGEDAEMSLRILAHGYRIINTSNLIAYHKITAVSRNSRLLLYNSVRNTLWMLVQYYPRRELFRALLRYHWYLAQAIVFTRRFYYLTAWAEALLKLYPMLRRREALKESVFSRIFFPLKAVFL